MDGKTFWIHSKTQQTLPQGHTVKKSYPDWVLGIAVAMILAGVLPIPVVLLLRRFQCLALDVDIHQGSIRRIETTVSTKEMMSDQDVSQWLQFPNYGSLVTV